jgi:hypothetical protein
MGITPTRVKGFYMIEGLGSSENPFIPPGMRVQFKNRMNRITDGTSLVALADEIYGTG